MRTVIEFIKEIYSYSRKKFILNIIFMIFSGMTGGVGILMLIPLLSIIDIGGNGSYNIEFLQKIVNFIRGYDKSLQLTAVLTVYLFLITLQSFITRELAVLNSEIIQGYTKQLRDSLYEKILRAEWSAIIEKKKSDLLNGFTMEINRVAAGAVFFMQLISKTLIAIVQIYIAFILSPFLTGMIIACGILMFWVLKGVLNKAKKLGSELHLMNRNLMSQITEHLNGFKEIKSCGLEESEIKNFKNLTAEMEKNMVEYTRANTLPDICYKIGAAVIVTLFFYFAINYLKLDTASLLVIIFIFAKLWPIFSSLQSGLQNIFTMIPSYISLKKAEKSFVEHAEKIYASSKTELFKNVEIKNSIKFENISFSYSDRETGFKIENMNIEFNAKKINAIVGKSGSGKSTTADLLMGLLKPQCGKITADNSPVNETVMREWREIIGYVPQEPFLLNGTIRENFEKFVADVSEEEIYQALEMASAEKFVKELSNGIDTVVGDRGIRLSGGERQRIVLARALLRRPQILVLDEATSALDSENEAKIQSAIEGLRGKLTVVVIAHRLSTIQNADSIFVMENGKVAEQGSYQELLKKESGYLKKMVEAGSKTNI